MRERPVGLIQTERCMPDRVEYSGECDDAEARAGQTDRAGDGERDEWQAERRAKPAAQLGCEREVRERDRREEVHGVDEEMRRREEIFERVRGVPALVPLEADAEGEEVEDDREPQKSVRGRDIVFLLRGLRRGHRVRAHSLDTLLVGHAVNTDRIRGENGDELR